VIACDCPADLSTNLSYITVEPSLRFAPFKSNFYLYGGPRLAFNLDKSFTYQLGINPAYPDQTTAVKGDFDKIEKQLFQCKLDMIFHFQRMQTKHNCIISLSLSNLILVKIHAQQKHGTIMTVRAGVALKFGQGKTFKKLLISKQTNKFRFL
jgi:hypothetical protein